MNGTLENDPLPPIAVVAGVRTPFAKAFTKLADRSAVELGRVAVEEAIKAADLTPDRIDEVVMGNVSGPPDAANIARVVALKAGLPIDRPAHTVNRNCASGMESIFGGWQILRERRADLVVAGGTESMSNVPFLWDTRMRDWMLGLRKAKGLRRLAHLAQLRPGFFKPIPGLELGLTDPVCGLNMGQTAEIVAKEFDISRKEQDEFALASHQRAIAAWDRCFLGGETVPVPLGPDKQLEKDFGPRNNQTMEALAKLKPLFDRQNGTVTAGNSCPITDGAAALVLARPQNASDLDVAPLGYIRGYAVAGCDPRRMGLGPVFAIDKLLRQTGMSLSDFDLFEINEAFSAQVLGCLRAFDSDDFAQRELQRDRKIGELNPDLLNVNGGAIALGHPVGTSGTRIVLTLLRSLKERGLRRGIASLCVGGGQGAAVWLDTTLDD
ncbi:thiolase family protein [Stratiformator vulcanicus]|uniref:Acetyl-CoA acetyltransferase n=1 Tax=Stratiformator vulcanicus TaxID=2527980 RepID=A0A517QVU8_9PLAN|nr:thiolase family protein [Stratiformator vulcanicus]QDT35782.1 Acetyl-CoA acetyltransferase [Stratiformator vulcanicus]